MSECREDDAKSRAIGLRARQKSAQTTKAGGEWSVAAASSEEYKKREAGLARRFAAQARAQRGGQKKGKR